MSNFQWYRSDIDAAWIYQLESSFNRINDKVGMRTGHYLKAPIFGINYDLNHNCGEWHKDTRQLVLAGRLLKGFEWAAVEYVMKHETAHMIVDEIFAIDANPHGDAWARACKIVEIDPQRTSSADFLQGFKGRDVSPLIEKIRKLIIHGNDRAASQAESEAFLAKAQELMIKYNLEMAAVQGADSKRFYIKRPVGPLVNGHKSWLGQAAMFIADYYDVRCIWSYCNGKRRIEFFGEPGNLDIAEYVFHALLNTGEELWKQYYEEHKEKIKDADYRQKVGVWSGKLRHRVTKNAFMQGLVNGYRDKLAGEKREVMDTVSPEDKALILASDGMLEEAYQREYHPRSGSRSYCRGGGYHDGHAAGSNLSLSKGVSGGGSSGRFLSS